MIEDYLELIEKQHLFQGITLSELENMFGCLKVYEKKYKKSEFILLSEQAVKCIGIILKGRINMIKEDLWGNRTILAIMKESEIFGETFACGSNQISTVSFQAVEDTQVLFLPFERVMLTCSMACTYHHRLIENMVTLIADKNVQLMEKIEITSKKTIKEKIAAYLTNQAMHEKSNYFTVPLGRVELAEYLCTDRSALTRELNLMREQGLIDFEKNTFRILKELQI